MTFSIVTTESIVSQEGKKFCSGTSFTLDYIERSFWLWYQQETDVDKKYNLVNYWVRSTKTKVYIKTKSEGGI